MIEQDLIDAGYKRFNDLYKRAEGCYQKRVYSDTGTRYFINVYLYDFTSYNIQLGKSFEVDCQFQDANDDYMNISFSVTNMTVEQLEQKIEHIFNTLDFVDYE